MTFCTFPFLSFTFSSFQSIATHVYAYAQWQQSFTCIYCCRRLQRGKKRSFVSYCDEKHTVVCKTTRVSYLHDLVSLVSGQCSALCYRWLQL